MGSIDRLRAPAKNVCSKLALARALFLRAFLYTLLYWFDTYIYTERASTATGIESMTGSRIDLQLGPIDDTEP